LVPFSAEWSLTLRDEHRLKVFENRALRRILGLKRNEAMGGWKKLHNEELHNLYSLPNIIGMTKSRRMRWAGHVACLVDKRTPYRVLVGESEEERPVGRLRHRWKDITTNLRNSEHAVA
jgi:hypothetical protein